MKSFEIQSASGRPGAVSFLSGYFLLANAAAHN